MQESQAKQNQSIGESVRSSGTAMEGWRVVSNRGDLHTELAGKKRRVKTTLLSEAVAGDRQSAMSSLVAAYLSLTSYALFTQMNPS
jgi:alkylated DNA nucleotide flippase Atl1